MGQNQFMPSSFLNFAQDFDGDGRKNIWGDQPTRCVGVDCLLLISRRRSGAKVSPGALPVDICESRWTLTQLMPESGVWWLSSAALAHTRELSLVGVGRAGGDALGLLSLTMSRTAICHWCKPEAKAKRWVISWAQTSAASYGTTAPTSMRSRSVCSPIMIVADPE